MLPSAGYNQSLRLCIMCGFHSRKDLVEEAETKTESYNIRYLGRNMTSVNNKGTLKSDTFEPPLALNTFIVIEFEAVLCGSHLLINH